MGFFWRILQRLVDGFIVINHIEPNSNAYSRLLNHRDQAARPGEFLHECGEDDQISLFEWIHPERASSRADLGIVCG